MSVAAIVLVVFLVLLIGGSAPVYPYSRTWGPYPAGGFSFLLLVLIILLICGVL